MNSETLPEPRIRADERGSDLYQMYNEFQL